MRTAHFHSNQTSAIAMSMTIDRSNSMAALTMIISQSDDALWGLNKLMPDLQQYWQSKAHYVQHRLRGQSRTQIKKTFKCCSN